MSGPWTVAVGQARYRGLSFEEMVLFLSRAYMHAQQAVVSRTGASVSISQVAVLLRMQDSPTGQYPLSYREPTDDELRMAGVKP